MIHTLKGLIEERGIGFFILQVGGIGFKIYTNTRSFENLRPTKEDSRVFCFLHFSDNQPLLFGFFDEPSLSLFTLLNKVPGVGPRTALNVLDVDSVENITAAILEKRVDLIVRAPGIGKKTAERIIIELQNKLHLGSSSEITKEMDVDADVEGALVGLGYSEREAKKALGAIGAEKGEGFENRLKRALKEIGKQK